MKIHRSGVAEEGVLITDDTNNRDQFENSTTCLIRHLCNPCRCIIWRFHFHSNLTVSMRFMHSVFRHSVYSDTKCYCRIRQVSLYVFIELFHRLINVCNKNNVVSQFLQKCKLYKKNKIKNSRLIKVINVGIFI